MPSTASSTSLIFSNDYDCESSLLPSSSSSEVKGKGKGKRKRGRRLIRRVMGCGGVKQRTLALGFAVAIFLGVAVYVRIWAIHDDSFSVDEREALRRQFDRANMEAMDESAQWRMKYDGEVARNRHYQEELEQVKESLASTNKSLAALQEENTDLQKQLESLTRKLQSKDQHCNCNP